jgi:hypothetical protein
MARPVVSATAERLYEAMGPMQDQDETHGWALLKLCDALTVSAAEVEAFAADTDTQAGWGPLLDVTAAPAKVLPYLAMFVGALITPALSVDQQRDLIRAAPGRRRGTPEAIKDAARLWLSGAKYVSLSERVGGNAYAVEVVVYESEVVDEDQLMASILAATPAGLALTITVSPGWTIAEMETATAANDVAYVEATWPTVNDFEREHP